MADLSPAAQAVWEAFNQEEPGVFVDYGDCLAAALRAAVAHTQQHHGLGVWECDANELLALAAELEGATTTALAKPEPGGPTDEELCELRGCFERILCVARSSGGRTVGNIELADRLIKAVLARYARPAIEPVPVPEVQP